MSDYISLEDLKAMNEKDVNTRYFDALFPFDMAVCGACVSMHKWGKFCFEFEHEEFKASAAGLEAIKSWKQLSEEIYALRLFYKDLYKNNPPEIMQPVVSVELEAERA